MYMSAAVLYLHIYTEYCIYAFTEISMVIPPLSLGTLGGNRAAEVLPECRPQNQITRTRSRPKVLLLSRRELSNSLVFPDCGA